MAGHNEYDIEGYSIFEQVRRSVNCYSLQPHERKSLEEIQKSLNGPLTKQQLRDYSQYLDSLESKLGTILITEEKEGMSNLQLRTELSFIRRLRDQTKVMLERALARPVA